MNPDNYGSFEACQRLVAAGIMLETEAVWVESRRLGEPVLLPALALHAIFSGGHK